MGAWGSGPFENDDAADFRGELDELPPRAWTTAIREALASVADADGYLEIDQGAVAIAAVAVVTSRAAQVAEFREVALRALDRAAGPDSELRRLWEENEAELPLWLSEVNRLRGALLVR
jgi:Domain of unknown function (DUF4259)